MVRDMDLVRLELVAAEATGSAEGLDDKTKSQLAKYSDEQRHYHQSLLIDAGFIDGKALKGNMNAVVTVAVMGLTWQGHELLDDIRNETVWTKTKERTGKIMSTASLAVLQEVAKGVARAMLGLP